MCRLPRLLLLLLRLLLQPLLPLVQAAATAVLLPPPPRLLAPGCGNQALHCRKLRTVAATLLTRGAAAASRKQDIAGTASVRATDTLVDNVSIETTNTHMHAARIVACKLPPPAAHLLRRAVGGGGDASASVWESFSSTAPGKIHAALSQGIAPHGGAAAAQVLAAIANREPTLPISATERAASRHCQSDVKFLALEKDKRCTRRAGAGGARFHVAGGG